VTLWERMLDRLEGPDRPKLIVVDPRLTVPARHADVHLPVRSGTNLALLNALLCELVEHGRVDRAYVDAHTVGYDDLVAAVRDCTPEWAAEICEVPAERIRAAAEILRRACRASTSRTRRRPRRSRSTTSTCCAGRSAARGRACCR
jgi:anaerobic selenocysteine-containing dehydrogenase